VFEYAGVSKQSIKVFIYLLLLLLLLSSIILYYINFSIAAVRVKFGMAGNLAECY